MSTGHSPTTAPSGATPWPPGPAATSATVGTTAEGRDESAQWDQNALLRAFGYAALEILGLEILGLPKAPRPARAVVWYIPVLDCEDVTDATRLAQHCRQTHDTLMLGQMTTPVEMDITQLCGFYGGKLGPYGAFAAYAFAKLAALRGIADAEDDAREIERGIGGWVPDKAWSNYLRCMQECAELITGQLAEPGLPPEIRMIYEEPDRFTKRCRAICGSKGHGGPPIQGCRTVQISEPALLGLESLLPALTHDEVLRFYGTLRLIPEDGAMLSWILALLRALTKPAGVQFRVTAREHRLLGLLASMKSLGELRSEGYGERDLQSVLDRLLEIRC
jgi:hypothetical protein